MVDKGFRGEGRSECWNFCRRKRIRCFFIVITLDERFDEAGGKRERVRVLISRNQDGLKKGVNSFCLFNWEIGDIRIL